MGEAGVLEDDGGFLAAGPRTAVDDDLGVFGDGDLDYTRFEGADGDQRGSEVGDGILMGLADIEEEEFVSVGALLGEVLDGDLGDAVYEGAGDVLVFGDFERADGGGLFDAAELVVVNEMGDGGGECRRRGSPGFCGA